MPLSNTSTRYGAITQWFHWAIVLLFVNQYVVAEIMIRWQADAPFWGLTQGMLYNWHKSVGLIALGVALLRYTWRKTQRLPDWAEGLSPWERRWVHGYERVLYAAMLIMPLSGYLFVEAGGYGVQWFGHLRLPTWLPRDDGLALLGRMIHIVTGYVIVIALTCHVSLVLKHQWVDRDGLLYRMIPGRRDR